MARREIILITGANAGIGFQGRSAALIKHTTLSLAAVHLSRSKRLSKSAVAEFPSSGSKLFPLQVDIEYDDAIYRAFGEVQSKFGRVDALINNAGAQIDQQLSEGRMTEREMWNQSWNINTAGSQVMTSTFIPLLLQGPNPRLLFITSGTATLAGTENMALFVKKYSPKGWPKGNFDGRNYIVPAYRSSKTGMNMMMREWHRLLHGDGIKVWCISPGYLATGLGGGEEANRKMGAGDPSVAADFIRSVLEGARDDDVGKVILKDGVQPW